jgi:AcrR family transcriptional regulator
MTIQTSRTYGGESAADRLAGRRDRLLDAGLELFGTDGAAGTTVRRVCAAAKLTPRYFYESFEDLDALLIAVFERVAAEAAQAVLEALAVAPADDARERSRVVIGAFVRDLTDDPRRARVAFVEAVGNQALMQRRFETVRMFSRLTAEEGGAFYGAGADDDPIVAMTASLLVGGLAELLLTWLDGSLAVGREQLIDDFSELFVATGESAVAIAARRAATGKRRGRA